jgi:hypothetical protein
VEPPHHARPTQRGLLPLVSKAGEMYIDAVQESKVFHVLYQIDRDLAEEERQHKCARCGGPLHHAFYQRKPRGGQTDLPEQYSIRMGLCCGKKGCRRRVLPPSCLFLGRRVYWAAIVLVVVALRQRRPLSASASKLRKLFNVSWETVLRWMSWFAEVFPSTELWKRRRGLVVATVLDDELPASLLDLFITSHGCEQLGLVACLEFLITGSSDRARSMMVGQGHAEDAEIPPKGGSVTKGLRKE